MVKKFDFQAGYMYQLGFSNIIVNREGHVRHVAILRERKVARLR